MKGYHTRVVIRAPPEAVWNTLLDFSHYPEWNPPVGWLRGDFRSQGRIRMYIEPLGRASKARVNRLHANLEYAWTGVWGLAFLLSGEHCYRFEDLGDGSTCLHHGEQFRGVLSVFLHRSLLQRMEHAFVAHNMALKERVEHE